MNSSEKIVNDIIICLGGKENISVITNCMTRLRAVVKDESKVDEKALKVAQDVMGLVHDRENSYEIVVGPGKSSKYGTICHEMGIPAAAAGSESATEKTASTDNDWKANKAAIKGKQKNSKLKQFMKVIGDIFVPLIPGVISAGLCAGFASLISQLCPGYADIPWLNCIYQFLSLINTCFMSFLPAWAGYRAAERFGASPILGGMLGMITGLDGINVIAKCLGLFNEELPLNSILRTGRGGVLAAILGVYILAKVEKKIRKHMPDSLDIVFTPLLTLIICVVPYVLVIMPALGLVSTGIVWCIGKICLSESIIVRLISGFISTAFFLPLVAMGMHHGLVALYSVQLAELGFVTLYPALAMAGAGQVGAAIAIRLKARKAGDKRLVSVIDGALPAGFLGVGEPLIYGVTLPLGRPFLTAGIGAGFGGAFVMVMRVASTTWGPSGILGCFVMTAGPNGAVKSIIFYAIGLVISYIMGFVVTNFAFKLDEPEQAEEEIEEKTEVKETEAVQPQADVMPPCKGRGVNQEDIPDETFSEGILGPCKGIWPSDGKLVAPISGKVTMTAETLHAVSIENPDGLEVLVHAGIDTVKLKGKGFELLVAEGDEVKLGDPIINMDLETIKKEGSELGVKDIVITVVCQADDPDAVKFAW